MKIWNLEKEYDKFIAFVFEGREKQKKDTKTSVENIKKELLQRGEKALTDFSRKWDGWTTDYPLKVSEEELHDRASIVNKKDLAALKGMIKNVERYHKKQGGQKRTYKRKGLVVQEIFEPVERVLIYVPGGRATYPSSLIMGVVPARIAGVEKIYATTPAFNGSLDPYVSAAALLLNVQDVYRIGGAQAVYAFAYGIGCIPRTDMIVGPGNTYVDEAKRDVYGTVGIDMLAGPTELIVFCTEAFFPDAVAWDLFSQGEHDEMAVVGMFSPSKEHIEDILKSIEKLINLNERKNIIKRALKENSFFVHYQDMNKAIQAINTIAPEHMELIGEESISSKIKYPGIIYLGPCTPVAMGDYYIGTNHVLPTGGAGRFTGGLSVDRFMRRKITVKIEKEFLEKYGDKAVRLSRIEGLFAHGESIKVRKGL